MRKLWKESIALVLGLTLLVACNGNNPFDREADPIKTYSSLKDDVDKEQVQPDQREQRALVKPFDIHVVSEDTKRLQFVAGEENRYEISARVFIDDVTYTLNIKKGPEGLELIEKDPEQGLWEVVWTPAKNAVAIKDDESEISLELELVITSSSDDAKAQIAALEKIANYTLEVRKSKKDPFIVGSQEFDKIKTIKEDQNVSFSLVVEDPAAFDSWSPDIIIDHDPSSKSQETNVLFAGSAITPDSKKPAENLKNGRWKTYWILHTPFLATIYKAKKINDKVKVEFRMQAISQVTDRRSAGWSKQVTIEFNKETQPAGDPQ